LQAGLMGDFGMLAGPTADGNEADLQFIVQSPCTDETGKS
jgi:hypothetical protein